MLLTKVVLILGVACKKNKKEKTYTTQRQIRVTDSEAPLKMIARVNDGRDVKKSVSTRKTTI